MGFRRWNTGLLRRADGRSRCLEGCVRGCECECRVAAAGMRAMTWTGVCMAVCRLKRRTGNRKRSLAVCRMGARFRDVPKGL